jgi:hypothetical protein
MYTPRLRRARNLKQGGETTLLGHAVAAAVHDRTEDLLSLTIEYFRCDGKNSIADLAGLLLRTLGEIHIQGEPTDRQDKIIDKASKELQKGHRQFRAAMTWLCSPKESDSAAPPSLNLLTSGKAKPGRYPVVDKKSENFVRYFEVHGLKHFKSELSLQNGRVLPVPRIVHYVDVFCACILDRCLGRKVSEMPLKICPRCHNLFLSERKQYCSKECQWKHHWTPERRADDKWVKDLEKFSRTCKQQYGRSIDDLQRRLAMPKTSRRLQSIKKKIAKKDWAGWARIAQRIEAIEDIASKSDRRN